MSIAKYIPRPSAHILTIGLLSACALFFLFAQQHRRTEDSTPTLSWKHIAPAADAEQRTWKSIIIHHSYATSGSSAGIDHDHLHNKKWDGVGYHFIIGNGKGMPLGRIDYTFRWTHQYHGAHAGNKEHNEHGIGICLIGNFEKQPPPPIQWQRAADLCAVLLQHYPQLSVEDILPHSHVRDGGTLCPGASFDMKRFREQVQSLIAP